LFIGTIAKDCALPFRVTVCSCNFFPGKKLPKNLVKTYASTTPSAERENHANECLKWPSNDKNLLPKFLKGKNAGVHQCMVQAISDKQPGVPGCLC